MNEAAAPLSTQVSYGPPSTRAWLQGFVFLAVWPAINITFMFFVLGQLGFLTTDVAITIALRIYPIFCVVYLLLLLLQRLFAKQLPEDRFWPQLLLHVAVFLLVGGFPSPILNETTITELPRPTIVPVTFMSFQIALYVTVKTLLIQREKHLATQLYLRQAQINQLRSQSNPHFLFNTLNLLASEVSRDPENAREIIYDLSDLLRESMQAAESEFVTLDEEVRLASLYLRLQQKRFPERLSFEIDVEDQARSAKVPSLLLQPIVENVIKHVVAHSTTMTNLQLWAHVRGSSLLIGVRDNGQQNSSTPGKPGGGLRIVRETLALHYRDNGSMVFEPHSAGSQVTLSLPLQNVSKET